MKRGKRKVHPEALPNHIMAVIDERKLVDFALNKAHTIGKDLADNFEKVLGFDKFNWQGLAKQIIEKLPKYKANFKREDICSKRYWVDIPIKGPNGKTATVRTVWILRLDADHPILDTLKVLVDSEGNQRNEGS